MCNLKKFYSVVFRKISKNHDFRDVFANFEEMGVHIKNPAVLPFSGI